MNMDDREARDPAWMYEYFAEIADIPQLMAERDCANCIGPLSIPIYTCPNGHNLCPSCTDELVDNKCPNCQVEMEMTDETDRNIMLEEELRVIILSCENQSQGCTAVLNSMQMRKHEYECEFRPAICDENDCNSAEIPLNSYISHLTTFHHCEEITTIRLDAACIASEQGYVWPSSVFNRFDKWFFMRGWMDKNYIGFYVAIFGTQAEANNFKCCVHLGHPTDVTKRRTVDILRLESFRRVEALGREYFSALLLKQPIIELAQQEPDNSIELYFKCSVTQNNDNNPNPNPNP